ncbi:helix-turn-helix domain-containing protein [Inediibacterium massiliense]|uniref:helix-turn-helix domain-containing protein n=1 Tax=Inediibacterium massiliense TaxID=1658111 RepID=UPI0006B5DDE4|nr:helix-turn-helix transcriptional regulator [Inediibacterium massiliense]
MSRIGDQIKEERIKKGMTPKQLGKKCGVAESFIIDIETGKKIINEKQLKQIEKILGKNFEESVSFSIEEKKEETKPIFKEKTVHRRDVNPLDQWEDALYNIIKKVPIYNLNMDKIKEYKYFPIIDKKVEGLNPEKIIYIQVPNDDLKEFRICRGDYILIYLNSEIVNHSIGLIEYEGKKQLRKIKKIDANQIEIISLVDSKRDVVSIKDIKVIGRGIRVEMNLNH